MDISKKIQMIKDTWFFKEPAYFIILCMMKIVETESLTNNISCNGGSIFINKEFFRDKSNKEIEEYLKVECVRIILKHPTSRMLPHKEIAYIASNALLASKIPLKYIKIGNRISVEKNESYEDIYIRLCKEKDGLNKKLNNSDDLVSKMEDAEKNAKIWEENESRSIIADNIIEKIKSQNSWGSLPEPIKSSIFAEKLDEPNYKSILRCFRKNMINSSKTLTRMKPNRRYGYSEMGQRTGYSSSLLFVGDTSGSMSKNMIGKYISFISGFFRYGIKELDFVQFDVEVYDKTLQNFRKKPKMIETVSCGGTNINDIIDFVEKRSKKKYDGVIICTDGYFNIDKKLWYKAASRNNYMFCIYNKTGYNRLRKILSNNINITYIENVND